MMTENVQVIKPIHKTCNHHMSKNSNIHENTNKYSTIGHIILSSIPKKCKSTRWRKERGIVYAE